MPTPPSGRIRVGVRMARSARGERTALAGIVVGLAVLLGGWLAFDGAHALVTGDYVTPRSGPHAGRLGPWSHAVSAVGLEPRSTLVESVHVVLGLAWLGAAASFVIAPRRGRHGLAACAVLGLWYLPFGTLLGGLQLALLSLPALRGEQG